MPLSPLANQPRSDLLVMFGASGDLAKKKLFPAVYRLEKRGLLGVPVIGVALDDWTDDDLRAHARAAIEEEGEPWDQAAFERLASNLHYVAGDYGDHTTFEKLRDLAGAASHPIFHLAIPPFLFGSVATGIAAVGLDEGARLIIEKPFGRDFQSAVELNATLHAHFPESAIFRIDHFIGKEATRNLLVTRFANAITEPLWNRNVVSAVKITMAESFGVEDRGAFYDSVGAMRDVMQNHLLQMVAILGMEQPVNEGSKALRDEKAKVLEAARVVEPEHFVRGQYDGYLDVPGVKPGSDTETYAAFRLDIDSPRWSGVPFFLRAGKAMGRTVTEMTLEFNRPPRPLWIAEHSHVARNSIRIEVKPENFDAITWLHKEPGEAMMPAAITLAPPAEERADTGPEPYELLIEEAMNGDPTLFAREDTVLESWRIVERILTDYPPVETYAQGSWGPTGASALVRGHGGWPEEPPGGGRVSDTERTGRPHLFVIRHGATEWSKNGRHTGITDLPLLPEGEDQARATAKLVAGRDFALVLTSPLQRARHTCELVGLADQAEIDVDLREFDYGSYEGITTATIRETVPGWTVWSHPCPGGETLEQAAVRVDRVIDRARSADGDVAVFAHGHILRILTARWCDLDPIEGRRFVLHTATLSELGWERDDPAVILWNSR